MTASRLVSSATSPRPAGEPASLGFEVRTVSVAPPVHIALVRRSVATLTSGDRDRTPSPAGLESDLTWSCPAPRSTALAFGGDCGIWDHACVQVAGQEVDARRSNTGASGQRSGLRVAASSDRAVVVSGQREDKSASKEFGRVGELSRAAKCSCARHSRSVFTRLN